MNDLERAKKERRGYYTSIRDENLNFHRRGLNARVGMVSCGEDGDSRAPLIGVIQVNAGPGDPLRGLHLHTGDAINLVVEGAMCMDGTWLRPGQAKIVPRDLIYGDPIASKDGCIFLEIFESHDQARPVFDNPRDQRYFDEVHGQYMADVIGRRDSPATTRSVEKPARAWEIAKFDEIDETWVKTGGLSSRCVFIGTRNSPDAPVGIAIKADRNISDLVASRRSFPTTTAMVVLDGSVMHDRRWMSVGDIFVCPPNQMNGDLVFGPDGAVIFLMFDKRLGIIPKFEDEKDQAGFDTLLRKNAEEVASGQCEKSVAILPLRDKHTKGRAIVYETIEAVERYRAETGTEW